MILQHKSEIKIMEILCRKWFREFSAYELAKEIKITAPMIYKTTNKLLKFKAVSKEKSRIKINFNNNFSYQFKLLKDADDLYSLQDKILSKILEIFDIFQNFYLNDLLSFIVIGSVATKETTEASDIDILILVKKKKEFDYRKKGLLRLGDINIIEKTKKEIENDYLAADDFILSALMNGLVIKDESLFRQLLIKPLLKPSNQLLTLKKERLLGLENRLINYLKDQDYKGLVNLFKHYLIEKGRFTLLQKGIIPSSKKDILNKIEKLDKNIYIHYNSVNEKNIKNMVIKNVGKS